MSLLGAQVSVLTWHNDAARTGQNLQETLLTPSNVNSTNFGLLFTLPVDGKVDAQPLYVPAVSFPGPVTHNVLYVATENDTVYAFDADTGGSPPGTPLWSQSVMGVGETASDNRGCDQVTPTIGITSTPAIDLEIGPNGTIFLVAMTKDGSGNYHQRLHALDLVSGSERPGWPIEVAATYAATGPNSSGGVLTFAPGQYKDRAALLISNGVIYTSWASHCDIDPFNGWIIGYNETTQAKVVLNLTPNGDKGAIWQAGAGPAVDAGGDLYVLMGNGVFDTALNGSGFPTSGDYGNSFMNISTTAGLAVQDYFTMDNQASENDPHDVDLGSGGSILLPTLNDALGKPHNLAVGAGKDGNAYIVDRNNMGKFNMSDNAVYQEIALGGPVFSSPAWFNNTLYYGPVSQQLKAYPFSGGSFGTPTHSTLSTAFVYPGTTPSISANGSTNGIVWAVETGSSAVLYAFDATTLNELYDSTQAANSRDQFGIGITFATPTVVNGKVYVGTAGTSSPATAGGVAVFGQLGCTYSIGIRGFSLSADPAGAGVGVNTQSGCPWSVANLSNFVAVTDGASGTGSGVVSFNVPANPGVSRTGTLMIAGQIFTVSQAGLTTTSGLGFYPLTPCRIADTRSVGSGLIGAFGPPSLTGGASRNFPVANSFCQSPANAQAYSLNMTVVPPGQMYYLTTWPAGQTQPLVSTLNDLGGAIVANAAIVPAGTNGSTNVFASNTTNLIMDINGYFAPPSAPQALAFYPVTPCRIADTRTASGAFPPGTFGPPQLTANSTRSFPVQTSSCSIPNTAAAYSLNLTVVPPGPMYYLTTWPDGQSQPVVSTLNDLQGAVLANAAIVPAGPAPNGAVDVFVSNATDLIMDINGYFAPPGSTGALYFYPLPPCRVADTRTVGSAFPPGTFGPPQLAGGATRSFPVQSSSCNVPAAAQAYSLNLTVVPPGGLYYLTTWPDGQSQPLVSTLNDLSGSILANAAIVPAGGNGAIDVFVSDPTDLIIDINGYFAP